MTVALKDTRLILRQERGVVLVESSVRPHRYAAIMETLYTVSAYWTPTRFYTGGDLKIAEQAFDQAVKRAPMRVR